MAYDLTFIEYEHNVIFTFDQGTELCQPVGAFYQRKNGKRKHLCNPLQLMHPHLWSSAISTPKSSSSHSHSYGHPHRHNNERKQHPSDSNNPALSRQNSKDKDSIAEISEVSPKQPGSPEHKQPNPESHEGGCCG